MKQEIEISEFVKKLDAVLKTQEKLPSEIATIAVNFSKERFRDQAWLDSTKHKWKPRKVMRGQTNKRSQTLLVDTGRLKRSIRKIKATNKQVIIGTDVPYAEIMKEER